MELKLSEFKSNDDMLVHFKDDAPCANIPDSKSYQIKKGELIPEIFIPLYLKNNPKLLQNLVFLNGIPQLTEEQQKKYGISFVQEKTTFEKEAVKEYAKFTLEELNVKVNEIGKAKFKDWAEETFGKNIDKRKSTENIIVEILEFQDAQ